MWIKDFRQFLNRSLERIGEWARGLEFLPSRWIGRGHVSSGEILPLLSSFWSRKIHPLVAAPLADQHLDVSYRYRSLHCHMRIQIFESTPGMQFIHRALQRSHEA